MSHKVCRICNSGYRNDIEELLSEKVQYREIARAYLDDFDCDLHLLEQSIANHKKHIPRKLSEEEKQWLDDLAKGKTSLDKISNVVAAKVFEKMLKNPDDFRFLDFFRMELLKLKKEETELEANYYKELVMRLFAGQLPPPECPKCDYPWMI